MLSAIATAALPMDDCGNHRNMGLERFTRDGDVSRSWVGIRIRARKRNHFKIGRTKSAASHNGSLAERSRFRQRTTPIQRNGSATASRVRCWPGSFAGDMFGHGTGRLKYSKTDQSRSKTTFRINRSRLYLMANNSPAQT